MLRSVGRYPSDGRRVLLLGLDPTNLARLDGDEPVVLNLHNLDGLGYDARGVDEVVIFVTHGAPMDAGVASRFLLALDRARTNEGGTHGTHRPG